MVTARERSQMVTRRHQDPLQQLRHIGRRTPGRREVSKPLHHPRRRTGLRQLTHYTGGKLQAYADDWSPDGTQIVFHLAGVQPNGKRINQLFVMNANGTGVHQLTHMSESANPRGAAWGTAE